MSALVGYLAACRLLTACGHIFLLRASYRENARPCLRPLHVLTTAPMPLIPCAAGKITVN